MTDDQFEKDIKESLVEVGASLETSHYQDGRYTISFINGQPGLVIRSDTPQEARLAIEKILPVFKSFKTAFEQGNKEKVQEVAEERGLKAKCETCGADMIHRQGTGRNGKPWRALMCPNSQKGQPGHDPIWL